MTAINEQAAFCFELSVSADRTIIATVRRFVGELCTRVCADADITSRIIVATHELLDNAVRHASADTSGIRVELRRLRNEIGVVITTTNRVNEERRSDLQLLLEQMRSSPDRSTFYQGLLRRAAERSEGSGLGLGRVHAESELNVSTRFEEGVVVVRAEGCFPLTKGAMVR